MRRRTSRWESLQLRMNLKSAMFVQRRQYGRPPMKSGSRLTSLRVVRPYLLLNSYNNSVRCLSHFSSSRIIYRIFTIRTRSIARIGNINIRDFCFFLAVGGWRLAVEDTIEHIIVRWDARGFGKSQVYHISMFFISFLFFSYSYIKFICSLLTSLRSSFHFSVFPLFFALSLSLFCFIDDVHLFSCVFFCFRHSVICRCIWDRHTHTHTDRGVKKHVRGGKKKARIVNVVWNLFGIITLRGTRSVHRPRRAFRGFHFLSNPYDPNRKRGDSGNTR